MSNNKPATGSGSSKFSLVLPGIGLHLNALATISGKDKIVIKTENLTGRPCGSLNPSCFELEEKASQVPKDNTYQLNGNAHQESAFGNGIGSPQSSSTKKRKKYEDVGETESCKRCNCRRSRCLKLYCECFAAGLYCMESCNCRDCFNKPDHRDTVLETRQHIQSRNPLAFSPKVVVCASTSNSQVVEVNKPPTSARHKTGCNCKKSSCLKKYCECFQSGVGCCPSCRCEGCKNTFGRKEGQLNNLRSSHDEISKTGYENQSTTPESSNNERGTLRQPFPLPPSPCLQLCLQDDATHTAMPEKGNIEPDDEAWEFLKGDNNDLLLHDAANAIRSTSPTGNKRIPYDDQYEFETSPGWKSCRKLILRSIPSISTVTNNPQSSDILK